MEWSGVGVGWKGKERGGGRGEVGEWGRKGVMIERMGLKVKDGALVREGVHRVLE